MSLHALTVTRWFVGRQGCVCNVWGRAACTSVGVGRGARRGRRRVARWGMGCAHAAAWCASRNGWRSSPRCQHRPRRLHPRHRAAPSPRHPARRCQLHAIRWTEQSAHGKARRAPPDEVCGMVARRGTWPVGHAPGASPATENGFRSSLSYPRACSSSATRQGSTRGKAGGAERSGARSWGVAAPLVTAAALSSAPATLSP